MVPPLANRAPGDDAPRMFSQGSLAPVIGRPPVVAPRPPMDPAIALLLRRLDEAQRELGSTIAAVEELSRVLAGRPAPRRPAPDGSARPGLRRSMPRRTRGTQN